MTTKTTKAATAATAATSNALVIIPDRPVFDAFKSLQTLAMKEESARLKIYMTLKAAGATQVSLSAKGAHLADIQDGVLTAWQGAAFVAAFKVNNGKVLMRGKTGVDAMGKTTFEKRPRSKWQMDLSGKVSQVRKAYVAWLDETAPKADSRNAEAPADASKADSKADSNADSKANKNAARDINVRVFQEIRKLEEAIKKDIASDKSSVEFDPAEMAAAFKRVKDLIPTRHRVAKN
mgnify:CR=1 FL=1